MGKILAGLGVLVFIIAIISMVRMLSGVDYAQATNFGSLGLWILGILFVMVIAGILPKK